jgi:HD-like signal output (HDOD) protein
MPALPQDTSALPQNTSAIPPYTSTDSLPPPDLVTTEPLMTTSVSAHSPLSTETFDRLVERAGELYSLPAVTLEVLDLTSNPDVDLRQLKACIERDPALTVRILRVVNSSLFGLSSSVSDLNQAIALLGCRPLKLLVLGFRLPQGLYQGVAAAMLKQYWHHTLAKAVAARLIAERLEGIPADEAFIAGLLQDIGILVMLQGVGDTYARFLDKVVAEKADLVAMQREVLGFDHTQLSSRMFKLWGLPRLIAEAVLMPTGDQPTGSDHPAGGDDESAALASVVQLADLFATMLVDDRPDVWPRLEQLATATGGLSHDELTDLGESLQERVDLLADALQIELPNDRDYATTMIRAHAQLSEVAAAAAVDLVRKARGPKSSGSSWRESVSLEEAVAGFEFNVAPIIGNIASGNIADDTVSGNTASAGTVAGEPVQTTHAGAACADATPGAARTAAARQEIGALGRQQLINHLAVAVTNCRRHRCPLSLLMIECRLDDGHTHEADAHDDDAHNVEASVFDRAVSFERLVGEAVAAIDHDGCLLLKLGPSQVAVILSDCDRQLAVELSNQLVSDVADFAGAVGELDPDTILLSIGVSSVSLPPKNFRISNLVEGASRCLYGASASGHGGIKSIEIY